MKTAASNLASSSGLLISMLFLLSKAAQHHVNCFSLAAYWMTPRHLQQQQSALVDNQRSQSHSSSSSSHTTKTRLFGFSGDAEEEEYEIKHHGDGKSSSSSNSNGAWSAEDLLPFLPSDDTHGQWTLRNDFYSFLNQCSIQSFLFLLKSLRDPYTVLWVENYTQSIIDDSIRPPSSFGLRTGGIAERSKLLNYHGLNALNTTRFPTWTSYFAQLLERPMEIYIIESQLPQVPDYEMEIKPASLCSRLIAIREQIGAEFAKDLGVIAEMGGHTLESYWDSLKELEMARREQQEMARRRKQEQDDLQSNDDVEEDNKAKPATFTGNEQQQHHDKNNNRKNFDVRRHNLMFLELSADASRAGQSPSPLRRGNFDLLTLLTTQEAIHRVLNDQEEQEEMASSNMARASKLYLTEFYMARISSHFAGNQRYGQADAFMAELLAEVPTMKLSPVNDDRDDKKNDGGTAPSALNLIDPTHIAQVIMEKRREVALEWEQMARLVPDKHLEIKRLQLTMLMMGGHFGFGGSSSRSSSDTPSSSSGGETKMLSFEEALRAKSKEDSGTCSTVAAMAAARAAAAAIPVTPQTTTTEPPATPPPTTTKRPLTTVPSRRKQSDFARSIQERKMGIAARARVSVASMAVPDKTTKQRVAMDAAVPDVPPSPRIRAMAGVGFGKKENSSRGAAKKLVMGAADAEAAAAPVSSMPQKRERRKHQQRTSSQNIKAPPPSVTLNPVVKDAFVSNIKEMREKAAALPVAEAATSKTIINQNASPPTPTPTRVIRLKNFNNHHNNKRNSNNNKKSTTMLAALPFNMTSIFE